MTHTQLTARAMQLREFFQPDAIALDLRGADKDAVLAELVGLLGMGGRNAETLVRVLQRRESLGSTGMGRGIAIPHCRSLVASHLRLAYGRHHAGVDFQAIDGTPVNHLFLIVAPPLEISNQYLPVLGRIAQFAKDADVPDRLSRLRSADEFFALLEAKGV
jgi:nitrogen PTS system EIIA component